MKESLKIPVGKINLEGELVLPQSVQGIVIFSHGSGSSRFSPRNTFVAGQLHKHQLGTLLFDLLTPEEDKVYENRFNIDLLTERLVQVTYWLSDLLEGKEHGLGYFGASTGAASALRAAARVGDLVKAVVSRGGRPDLAIPVLAQVQAPTLLLVGALDSMVIDLNRKALDALNTEKQLELIPNAGHLFEQPGTLEKVAELAGQWYQKHLPGEKQKGWAAV